MLELLKDKSSSLALLATLLAWPGMVLADVRSPVAAEIPAATSTQADSNAVAESPAAAPVGVSSEKSAERCSCDSLVDADRSDSAIQRETLNANRVSAKATVLIAVIGGLQLILFGWQLQLMRRTVSGAAESSRLAQVAAEAASLNARAAVGIELPILTAEIFGLLAVSRPFDPFDPPGGTVNDGFPGRYSGAGPISFKNNGRTPAFLESIELGWSVTDSLPPVPKYDVVVPLEHFSIIRPEETFQLPYEQLIELTPEQQASVRSGAEKLWVYGSLHYRDFLGDRRESRFCCHYAHRARGNMNPFGFVYDGRPPSAYVAQLVRP